MITLSDAERSRFADWLDQQVKLETVLLHQMSTMRSPVMEKLVQMRKAEQMAMKVVSMRLRSERHDEITRLQRQ